MKTITFICFIIILTSCRKDNIVYPPGQKDSSIKVTADIILNGVTSKFSAVGTNETIFDYKKPPGDSSIYLVTGSIIFGSQGQTITYVLGIEMVNILTTGTYNFGNSADSIKRISAWYWKDSLNKKDIYSNDDKVL